MKTHIIILKDKTTKKITKKLAEGIWNLSLVLKDETVIVDDYPIPMNLIVKIQTLGEFYKENPAEKPLTNFKRKKERRNGVINGLKRYMGFNLHSDISVNLLSKIKKNERSL